MKTSIEGFTYDATADTKPAICVYGEENVGKAQPLTSLVLSESGWKQMGSMEPGDVIRCPDNSLSFVLGVSKVVKKPVYRITFRDGRYADCCGEHLWRVWTSNWSRHPETAWKIISTNQLLNINQSTYIELPSPLSFSQEEELPIPPYAMGALLGDGGLTQATPIITDNDLEVIRVVKEELVSIGVDGGSVKGLSHTLSAHRRGGDHEINPLTAILQNLGLMGLYSQEKFIPAAYMQSSIESRWRLVQGMLDTDGNCNPDTGSGVNLSTSSPRLAKDFQYVIRSLGGEAKITSRIPYYTLNGERLAGLEAYRVWVRMPDADRLFSSPARKAAMIQADTSRATIYGIRLRIESIEEIGVDDVQCIRIAHPDQLYITNDFIVTHNSRFGCTAPHNEGLIGWLALDKNSKGAVETYKKANKADYLIVNKEPFLTNADAIKIAMTDNPAETKKLAKVVVEKVWKNAMTLAAHKDIESIVVDDGSILYDYILFSHFGRRNQIESFMRGGPNNDFIEFITAMSGKNLVMICRGAEIWADTGEVDKDGKKKQAPTGKLKPEGFGKIGKFMTAVIELSARRKKPSTDDVEAALAEKYHCKIVTCKGDTLLEGQSLDDYHITGRNITWDNIMTILKLED